jgi:hypothetical protein
MLRSNIINGRHAVHPLLLQLAQHQVLLIAIITPVYSSSINEPQWFGRPKNQSGLTLALKLGDTQMVEVLQGAAADTAGPSPLS